jgi:hypothetical protein
MKEQPLNVSASQSIDIVDVIRKLRNDLIKDFLDERNLIMYLSEQFRVMELSAIKVEFIKKDLKGLLIAPVDVAWYKAIIDDYSSHGSASLTTEGHEKLFYKEIEAIIKRHMY